MPRINSFHTKRLSRLKMIWLTFSKKAARIISVFVSAMLLHVFQGCSPGTPTSLERFHAKPHISAPPEYLDCANLINQHVIHTRALDERIFKVSYDGTNIQFNAPIFRVSHMEDYRNRSRRELGAGSGSSFFVVADCANMKIIKELKMQ